jgi:endonuclease III
MEFSPTSSTLADRKLYHAELENGSRMTGRVVSGSELVARLGPHPARVWGLDLGTDAGLARWLAAACLLAPRGDEEAAGAALRALAERGLDTPDGLASAGPKAVADALGAARYPKPEITAARLVRASSNLRDSHAGFLARLLSTADGVGEAGAALVALAPGLGPATAAEILRPLRDRFAAAREVPLTAAARAAAVHVGLLRPGEDEEGEPGALRAALAREHPLPDLVDVEAALTRLGRAACLRHAARRCPLGERCPTRES